ncbi:MAG: sigma-70 family RNA polymerase sigma factor [Planctomycetota bacterium]
MDHEKHQQFAERLVRSQHRVFAYLVSLVGNRADAEELFQQTSLTLWQTWDRYDPGQDFLPWACGIARNHVQNHLRKQQRSRVRLEPEVVELLANEGAVRASRDGDRLPALRDCLEKLPKRSRDVIAKYYGGASVASIAAESSSSANAVYKLLHRTRELLHDCVRGKMAETL